MFRNLSTWMYAEEKVSKTVGEDKLKMQKLRAVSKSIRNISNGGSRGDGVGVLGFVVYGGRGFLFDRHVAKTLIASFSLFFYSIYF